MKLKQNSAGSVKEQVACAASLIPFLHDVQAKHHYLPEDELRAIAKRLCVSLSRVYSVATFYKSFSLKPRGRHLVSMCMGTACHVRGSPDILDELERQMGIKHGETSADGLFSLETVNCLGVCALGPVLVVDGKYHGQMTPAKVTGIIAKFRAAAKEHAE